MEIITAQSIVDIIVDAVVDETYKSYRKKSISVDRSKLPFKTIRCLLIGFIGCVRLKHRIKKRLKCFKQISKYQITKAQTDGLLRLATKLKHSMGTF